VLLKENLDKQVEDKRLMRKKLLQIDTLKQKLRDYEKKELERKMIVAKPQIKVNEVGDSPNASVDSAVIYLDEVNKIEADLIKKRNLNIDLKENEQNKITCSETASVNSMNVVDNENQSLNEAILLESDKSPINSASKKFLLNNPFIIKDNYYESKLETTNDNRFNKQTRLSQLLIESDNEIVTEPKSKRSRANDDNQHNQNSRASSTLRTIHENTYKKVKSENSMYYYDGLGGRKKFIKKDFSPKTVTSIDNKTNSSGFSKSAELDTLLRNNLTKSKSSTFLTNSRQY
jgi:hypothetical protein